MNQAWASAPRGLWPSVWKLLRLRVVIFASGFRRATTRRKVGLVALAVTILMVLAGAFLVSWLLLRFLRSPMLVEPLGDVSSLLANVPVLLLGGAFLGILLTSFGVLLQALYLAGDMDFLLSAPIPIRAVFIAKLLQAILPNFCLISLFALPVLYGLGAAGGYSLLYYPLVLVVLAALALAAAGLSSVLVMAIVRLFPARRVAEVLGFLGALVSIVCSQSGQLANFNRLSPNQAQAAIRLATRFSTPWSPLAWAGRGLVDVGEGRWLVGAGFLALTLGLAILVFGAALTSAERLYYTGWASIQGSRRKKRAPRAARAPRASAVPGVWDIPAVRSLPSAVRAIVAKDFVVLRRDLRNMSQLVTPLIFGIIYAVMLLRSGGAPPAGRGEAPAWFMQALTRLMAFGNLAISLFVGWALMGRVAGMGFSQEGKSYWLLKTAPVSSGQLLAAKFTVAYLPALALGWGFLVIISVLQRVSPGMLAFQIPVVALCIAGMAGINLAFGVTGAKLDWEDPRQMMRGGTGCLGALASVIYVPLDLALFLGPTFIVDLLGWPEVAGQVGGLVLGGAFSLACAVVPLWLVRGRVPRLGEA